MAKMNKKWVILCSTAIAAVYTAGYITTEAQASFTDPPYRSQVNLQLNTTQRDVANSNTANPTANQHSVAKPRATYSPATNPSVTRPPVSKPSIIRPSVAKPRATHPSVTKTSVTRPPVAKISATYSPVTKSSVIRPKISKPSATQPPVTKTSVTRPPVAKPSATHQPVTNPSTTLPSANVSANTTAASQYKDGTYVGMGINRRGSIQVNVTIEKDKIIDVEVSDFAMHYSERDIVGLPDEVLQTQNALVKNVTGATYSTQAFADAVQDALSQAKNG